MLRVGDSVSHHVFEEDLEYVASFIIDESTDTLDSASASESADCWLGDALDVLADNTSMALLGADLAQSLAALASADHGVFKRGQRGAFKQGEVSQGSCVLSYHWLDGLIEKVQFQPIG